MEKVKFENLSVALKIPIVASWIMGVTYAIFFLVGFIGEIAI